MNQAEAITALPVLGLQEGEKHAFSITLPSGKTIHIILLPGDVRMTWNDAMEWAKSIGGDLPGRAEQALLYKYLPEEFEQDFYWSNQQRESYSLSAWGQHFSYGGQYRWSKFNYYRARAVRRVVIE